MAENIKILGQQTPGAGGVPTLAYSTPGATSTVMSSLIITNTNATRVLVRVYVVPSGGSALITNAIYYDLPITGNNTLIATVGLTLGALDDIFVRSDTANVNFQFFGTEVS